MTFEGLEPSAHWQRLGGGGRRLWEGKGRAAGGGNRPPMAGLQHGDMLHDSL